MMERSTTAFIDNELPLDHRPFSHAAGYEACGRTDPVTFGFASGGDGTGRPALRRSFEKQYADYREMIEAEQPDIVSVATQPEHRAEIVVFEV